MSAKSLRSSSDGLSISPAQVWEERYGPVPARGRPSLRHAHTLSTLSRAPRGALAVAQPYAVLVYLSMQQFRRAAELLHRLHRDDLAVLLFEACGEAGLLPRVTGPSERPDGLLQSGPGEWVSRARSLHPRGERSSRSPCLDLIEAIYVGYAQGLKMLGQMQAARHYCSQVGLRSITPARGRAERSCCCCLSLSFLHV
jgi:hypothetical protein